ncbi:hypothetical protein G7Y79_00059g091810 [Physcia stellaris]|nr:hypothetical protein G7Y79_00059g091810 [Physcia stellaris]
MGFILFSVVIALCTNLILAYPPSCSEIYGQPTAADCANLLAPYLGTGAERGVSHFFGIPGLDRPSAGVSRPQYAQKVDIPKFWSSQASPGCRVALLPVESLSFEMSWDTGRYLPIAQVGQQINHYCVEAMGLPVAGRGGVERVGDNENLRLILYAPRSQFENEITADYKDSLPISIHEEDDPTNHQPDKSFSSKKRRGGGTDLATGMGTPSRTRSLGGGWYLDFDSLTSVEPSLTAPVTELQSMYDSIVQIAAGQLGKLGTAALARRRIGFSYGAYRLRLESQEPIAWTWVVNFAEAMREVVASRGAALFRGKAYSYYWEVAAVGAALTVG